MIERIIFVLISQEQFLSNRLFNIMVIFTEVIILIIVRFIMIFQNFFVNFENYLILLLKGFLFLHYEKRLLIMFY